MQHLLNFNKVWEAQRENPGCNTQMLMESALDSLNAPTEVVKQIIINIEAGVEVEVTIAA